MAHNNHNKQQTFYFSDVLWDIWCVASIIGIWPRFIEPNLVSTTQLAISLPNLSADLQGLRIVQFSDLHLNRRVSDNFLKKLSRKINALSPDIIIFSGDFLCYSILDDKERLKNFLCSLHAPYGCYAVLGNHDYNECVSINENGDYDIFKNDASMIKRGFERLFTTTTLTKKVTSRAQAIGLHKELLDLLAKTPFTVLNNSNVLVPIKNSHLNLCGLGEYTLGKTDPNKAFEKYERRYPGIILLHNPDGVPLLQNYPGHIVLSGHTHGGQINLPWMWRKFTLLENEQFKKGLVKYNDKWVYINRGIGGVMQFRWFSVPEILLLTLEGAK